MKKLNTATSLILILLLSLITPAQKNSDTDSLKNISLADFHLEASDRQLPEAELLILQ